MDNTLLASNLLQNAYEQAASSAELSQKWSSDESWNFWQLYQEIMFCETQDDQLSVTRNLAFATKRGYTRTPKTPPDA